MQLPSHAHEEPGTSPAQQGPGTGAQDVVWVTVAQVLRQPGSQARDLSTGVIFKPPFGILLAKFLNDLG